METFGQARLGDGRRVRRLIQLGAAAAAQDTCFAGCWISGKRYKLGDPNPATPCVSCQPALSRSSWSDVPSRFCVQKIAAGKYHNCAIINGGAFCWGRNPQGGLGNNTTNDSWVPVPVQGLSSGVTHVAAGWDTSCAVINGAVRCWGANGYLGALGNDSTADSWVPVQPKYLDQAVTDITVGDTHSCVIHYGSVQCWGSNSSGALGNENVTEGTSLVPTSVSGLSGTVTALDAGLDRSCALVDGIAYCWGNNSYGVLGNSGTEDSVSPVEVKLGTSGATAIATSSSYSACAIVNGRVFCWGSNAYGQLGNSTKSNSLTPVEVQGLTGKATAISANGSHACAVSDGRAYCWGSNQQGQLGIGESSSESLVAAQVVGLTSGVTAITTGTGHSCAIANGNAYCWGDGDRGQLGNNDSTMTWTHVPVQVVIP